MEENPVGKKKIINVGIAGLGRSGWSIHSRLLEPLSDKYKITAVFDQNPERLNEAQARFGCVTYSNFNELINDSTASLLIIAMPNHLHADYTMMALQGGKDVVCEKPMAGTAAEADRMIAKAKERGRMLTIFQNRRYAPDFLQVKRVIDSGKLGRIVMIHMHFHSFTRRWDWQTLKKYNGGTLNNTAPHIIDQALILLGNKEPEIFCDLQKTQTLGDTDDHNKLILKAPGAPLIDIEITATSAYSHENWQVMGTLGGLSGTAQELRWKYLDPAKAEPRMLSEEPVPDRSYCKDEFPWVEESWSVGNDHSPGETGYYLDLYHAYTTDQSPPVTPASVRRQIAIIEKCHQMAGL
jgi:predicted dehydrogenase